MEEEEEEMDLNKVELQLIHDTWRIFRHIGRYTSNHMKPGT